MTKTNVIYGYVRIHTKDNKEDIVKLTDVICVIARRDYCEVHTRSKKYTLTQPMCEVEEKLTLRCFVRVGRSCVVNITCMEAIMGNMLLMNNNTQIVVSRAAMTEFRERLEPLGSRTRDKKKIRGEDE